MKNKKSVPNGTLFLFFIYAFFEEMLLAEELVGDDPADLIALDHLVDLSQGDPLGPVGLSREQDDLIQGSGALQTVKIIVGRPVGDGFQQLEFLF